MSGSTRNLLIYIYDASGQPIGINYLKCVGNTVTKEAYLLGTNIQGDITCIYDTAGNRVVTYTYDAWGKILSVTGTAANTIGRYNPFRYRGYYYDNETGFYYLNSRYYDPGVGRFLNADGIDFLGTDEGLLSYNLFAYCLNDPVNRTDDSGNLSIKNWIKIGVGAIALGAAIALTVATGGGAAAVAIGVAKVVGSVALSTATSAGIGYLTNGKISIHAPREGSDSNIAQIFTIRTAILQHGYQTRLVFGTKSIVLNRKKSFKLPVFLREPTGLFMFTSGSRHGRSKNQRVGHIYGGACTDVLNLSLI